MLESVTDNDGGTAPKARGYGDRVAGKTGTSWKINPITKEYFKDSLSF